MEWIEDASKDIKEQNKILSFDEYLEIIKKTLKENVELVTNTF